MTANIKQIYRDCNAASHYLKEALTTSKCKGPLRGKILVRMKSRFREINLKEDAAHSSGAL